MYKSFSVHDTYDLTLWMNELIANPLRDPAICVCTAHVGSTQKVLVTTLFFFRTALGTSIFGQNILEGVVNGEKKLPSFFLSPGYRGVF